MRTPPMALMITPMVDPNLSLALMKKKVLVMDLAMEDPSPALMKKEAVVMDLSMADLSQVGMKKKKVDLGMEGTSLALMKKKGEGAMAGQSPHLRREGKSLDLDMGKVRKAMAGLRPSPAMVGVVLAGPMGRKDMGVLTRNPLKKRTVLGMVEESLLGLRVRKAVLEAIGRLDSVVRRVVLRKERKVVLGEEGGLVVFKVVNLVGKRDMEAGRSTQIMKARLVTAPATSVMSLLPHQLMKDLEALRERSIAMVITTSITGAMMMNKCFCDTRPMRPS